MGKKGKKSTSFRIDEGVLRLLTEKAERISKQTNRSYSMATIVDTALSETCQEPDDVTLSKIAKHQFGIDVVKPPGSWANALVRKTDGTLTDDHIVLNRGWVSWAKTIPLNGKNANSLPGSLLLSIEQMEKQPDVVEDVLNTYVDKNGSNGYVVLLYKLLELYRGTARDRDTLEKLHWYYTMLCMSGSPDWIDHYKEEIKKHTSNHEYEDSDALLQMVDASCTFMLDWENS